MPLPRYHAGADRVQSLDVMLWAHGMVAPIPGFLWSAGRLDAGRPKGRIHFAHSDLSGISLFEEAWTQGIRAGREAADALARA